MKFQKLHKRINKWKRQKSTLLSIVVKVFYSKPKIFYQKISIIKRAKTTVKKYLAQVICKTSIEELKYFAKASIKGTIIQAEALSITAFMKEA